MVLNLAKLDQKRKNKYGFWKRLFVFKIILLLLNAVKVKTLVYGYSWIFSGGVMIKGDLSRV